MRALQIPSSVAADVEALFREARLRRRRRWILGGILAVAVTVALVGSVVALGGSGGGGGGSSPARSARPPSASIASVAETVAPGSGVVGRGPTAIDFSDLSDGWIASGGNADPQLASNPTIVRTTDGGQTWQRTPVPNLAAQSVNPATNRNFGALVGIHFATATRGWFFQAGIGWQTNDAGTNWALMHLPVDGALVGLTSAGNDVWALIDTCPIDAVSCPQNLGKGTLYHATTARVLKWRRAGGALPAGYGVLYPSTGESVVVAFGDVHYREVLGKVAGPSLLNCELAGALNRGEVAGVCGGGGGGNASLSKIAVSGNGGTTWHPLIDGPPSTQWMGTSITNGADAIFYVTGGQTLWRTSTSAPGWHAVLETQAGSTDEIYPIYMTGIDGYALISNGLDADWYETNDDGLSWEPVVIP